MTARAAFAGTGTPRVQTITGALGVGTLDPLADVVITNRNAHTLPNGPAGVPRTMLIVSAGYNGIDIAPISGPERNFYSDPTGVFDLPFCVTMVWTGSVWLGPGASASYGNT